MALFVALFLKEPAAIILPAPIVPETPELLEKYSEGNQMKVFLPMVVRLWPASLCRLALN